MMKGGRSVSWAAEEAVAAVVAAAECGGGNLIFCRKAAGFGGKAAGMAHGVMVIAAAPVLILLHNFDFLDFDFDKDDDDEEDSSEDPDSEPCNFLLPAFDLQNFFNLLLQTLLLLVVQNLKFFAIQSLQIPSPTNFIAHKPNCSLTHPQISHFFTAFDDSYVSVLHSTSANLYCTRISLATIKLTLPQFIFFPVNP